MTKINICLSCDDNYAKYAGVVIASVLFNARNDDEISFYVFDGEISDRNKELLLSLKSIKNCDMKFVKVNPNLFDIYSKIKTHKYVSLPSYYKLKFPTFLPDVKRAIYLDCDVVVDTSLHELFEIDMQNYAIAGVKDINKGMIKKNFHYVNAGVLLMDFENFRKQKLEQKFDEYTKKNSKSIKMGDQEILNAVLKNNIKILDDEWNVQSSNFINRSSYTLYPKIVHFVSKRKPWHYISFSWHKNLFLKYLQMTPWALSDSEYKYWAKDNKLLSLFSYLKYRPFFFIRPRFYKALFLTYIKPLFSVKRPIIKGNTFIVWEPCSKSHSEVVPGYVKYLTDLGYNVSVLVNPDRLKEGLFCRYKNPKVFLNKMNKHQIYRYFKYSDLSDVMGVMVTTVGKICDNVHFDDAYKVFNKNIDKSKLLFVVHDAKPSIDAGTFKKDLIFLRDLDYKNKQGVVVNPHYFGDVKILGKNKDITNFVMVGALRAHKQNSSLIIDTVKKLYDKGYKNFKVTVIGKGSLDGVPKEIRPFFDIKGRLPFSKMYDELEKSDFMLTAYDKDGDRHSFYRTSGTSGNFQLVYGFGKPCLIIKPFAKINGFDKKNSIIYDTNGDYVKAMEKCIKMTSKEYNILQKNLLSYSDKLYKRSLRNLKNRISG